LPSYFVSSSSRTFLVIRIVDSSYDGEKNANFMISSLTGHYYTLKAYKGADTE